VTRERDGGNIAAMDDSTLFARIDEAASLVAGAQARDVAACRARLAASRNREPDIEFKCALHDPIAHSVFLSLCVVYGLEPYRVPRQRTSDACIRAPRSFVRELFWPEFNAIAKAIEREFLDATERAMVKWSGQSLEQIADRLEPGR